MKRETKRDLNFVFRHLRLNIQQFADDPAQGEGQQQQPKTYTEEEYNKAQAEIAKYKASFDKASSELAEAKKEQRARLSEEQQKAIEEAERQKKIEDLEKSVKKYELKDSLSKSFTVPQAEELSNAIIEGDFAKVTGLIVKYNDEFMKTALENAKKEFSKSAKVPGGNDGDGEDDVIANLAKSQSQSATKENKNWDNYKQRH